MTTWNTIAAPGKGANLISNGTFDTGKAGWTGGTWDSDLHALKVTNTVGSYTTFNFTNGVQYQLSFAVVALTADGGGFDIVQGDSSSNNLIVELLEANIVIGQTYTYTFTADNSQTNPTHLFITASDGDSFWFDNITMYKLPFTATIFTDVNAHGNEAYDQFDMIYDASADYYDGINPYLWSSVASAPTKVWTNIPNPV